MRTKVLALVAVVIVVACAMYGLSRTLRQPFPPKGVACFDSFENGMQNGYSSFTLPSFDLSNIHHFRCASQKGFTQYEVSGTDTSGRAFYVQYAGGGMAASGADSYLDACYKQDDTVVQSIKLVGRDTKPGNGSCAWINSFPTTPASQYEYTARSN